MGAKVNLTGVTEIINGRYNLQKIYQKILRILEKMPADSAYMTNTKQIICHRLAVLDEFENTTDIERVIGCGRFEILVSQAHGEFLTAQKMLLYKPWEPLIQQPPPGQWKWPCSQ